MNKITARNGFTLAEIMISTAIGAIILGALFISFTMFQRSYELQREMTRNQENGRMVLDFMVDEIRNAGYREFNEGSPIPINQAVILERPRMPGITAQGPLPSDCGESIAIVYDIVPSQNDMINFNFVRRIVRYFGEVFLPGGQAALARCQLTRSQCHYANVPGTLTFARINGDPNYPCNQEKVMDYLYELSFSFSDYKYDAFAGRLNPMTRGDRATPNYANGQCLANLENNIACPQYADRVRTIDMYLAVVSGKEISSIQDEPGDNPDKGRRFLTHFNSTIVLRNL